MKVISLAKGAVFARAHLKSSLTNLTKFFKAEFLVLKKSFTLVELSIVLLVLALLVSTLLVGRQIIDRAKVQQIMSEIDYYTKNFQMFRDQYDFLPGALDEKNCRKYPEFALQKPMNTNKYSSQCDDPDSMFVEGESNVYRSFKQANFSIVDMVASGMIENRSPGERVRKHFDIADTTETTTISMPYCIGNMTTWSNATELNEILKYVRYIDIAAETSYGSMCGGLSCRSGGWTNWRSGVLFEVYYNGQECVNNYTGINKNLVLYNSICSSPYLDENGCSHCGSDKPVCCNSYQISTNSYVSSGGIDFQKRSLYMTSAGCTYLNSKIQRSVSETKTIPGEKRRGYLLKKDEIENQANRSVFDGDVWITYSGGKVQDAYIYGIEQSAMTIAENNNTIAFFKYDDNKSEVEADGAISYNLYNLLQKKIGEAGDGTRIGNLHIQKKSTGEGVNFIYIMK